MPLTLVDEKSAEHIEKLDILFSKLKSGQDWIEEDTHKAGDAAASHLKLQLEALRLKNQKLTKVNLKNEEIILLLKGKLEGNLDNQGQSFVSEADIAQSYVSTHFPPSLIVAVSVDPSLQLSTQDVFRK